MQSTPKPNAPDAGGSAPTATVPAAETDYSNPHVCDQLKIEHDECFYQWYAKYFVKGTAARHLAGRQPCEREFDAYSTCVSKKMTALDLSWVAEQGIGQRYLDGTSGPDYELMKKMRE